MIKKIIFISLFLIFSYKLFGLETPDDLIIENIEIGDKNSDFSQESDLLTVNYQGWIFNEKAQVKNYCNAKGKMFDSNVDEKFNHKKNFQFILGKGIVIKGWDEGLKNMYINGKRCIVIPSKLAYGNRKIGNIIEPNSTLIFEVHLLNINKGKK